MDGYVLELSNNKYYVGISDNIDVRLDSHFKNKGSKWSQLHKPIRVVERFIGSKDSEREFTLKYMREYGWQNVRGGGWTAVNMRTPIPFR